MSDVGSSDGSGPGRREQLIGARIPPAVRRSATPVPLVAPMPAGLGLAAGAEAGSFLPGMPRLDASGRFCAGGLLQALGWGTGASCRPGGGR
jgi:hypothetical protein